MSEQITLLEAARITRHETESAFLGWAYELRYGSDGLHPFLRTYPGEGGTICTLVDKNALERSLGAVVGNVESILSSD